jgi:hypothetical protein
MERGVVANIKWHSGDLFPRIGFIVTNSRLAAGKVVNAVAHQASVQGGSESRVSWSEVISPCGVGLPFGSTLPRRVRVMSVAEKAVDQEVGYGLHSEAAKEGLFRQRDDSFAYVRSSRTPQRQPIGVSRAIPQSHRDTKRFKKGRPPHNCG